MNKYQSQTILDERKMEKEESQIRDIAIRMRRGESNSDIAKELGISRQEVASLLAKGFSKDYFQTNERSAVELAKDLDRQFNDQDTGLKINFFVVAANEQFYSYAASKILRWIAEKANERESLRPLFIAISSGRTMLGLAEATRTIMDELHLRDGIHSRPYGFNPNQVRIINACSGGQIDNPRIHGAHVALTFAEALGSDAFVHSLAVHTKREKEKLKEAIQDTGIWITGIGSGTSSSCLGAMYDDSKESKPADIGGDFMYHVFNMNGENIPTSEILEIKENSFDNSSENTQKLFSTLYRIESMKPSKESNRRTVIGVVPSGMRDHQPPSAIMRDSEPFQPKSEATYMLVSNGFFTHLVVSSAVAKDLIKLHQEKAQSFQSRAMQPIH